MAHASLAVQNPRKPHRPRADVWSRWLAATMLLALLAGCEHGDLSYDSSSGNFRIPIGAGSRETR